MDISCVIGCRPREVQLHTPPLLAGRQLRPVPGGGAAQPHPRPGGRHGHALPPGEPLLRPATRYNGQGRRGLVEEPHLLNV